MSLDVGQFYTTINDTELVCFEKTENYSYMCGYELVEDNVIRLDFNQLYVYPNNGPEDGSPTEAIEYLYINCEEE